MKIKLSFVKKSLSAAIITASLIAFPSMAAQCDINFKYGVVIDPTHIRILDKNQTLVQINGSKQLFVRGQEVSLSKEQQQLVIEYSSGIRQQIPEIVSIAIEGVEVGLKTVNKVIAGLTGENSATHQKLQKRFDELQWRLRSRFNHSDKNFYIAPQDFDDFDEIFAGEFEHEIEEIVTESIGTILMAVGEAMTNEEQESSEQRVNTFGERMSTMGEELELEISSKADAIATKADLFCHQLKKLDKIETQLTEIIPQLSDFNLIQTNN